MRSFFNSRRFALLVLGFSVLAGFVTALVTQQAVYGASAIVLVYATGNSIALAFKPVDYKLGPTLTSTDILLDVIDAFAQSFPPLNSLGMDFKKKPVKKDEQLTAHIHTLPTVATYDAVTGYRNGAQQARSLLVDVDVKADQHKHVPLLWKHLNNISDRKNEYKKIIGSAGYALAKHVVDQALTFANSRNFSQSSTFAVVDSDVDMLIDVCGDMNLRAAMGGRTLLVNTPVAGTLSADSRITSSDFAGQYPGSRPLRRFSGIHGFETILEYPDLPTNNGVALTGLTGTNADDTITKAAHGLKDGDRVTFPTLTGGAGLTAGSTPYFVRDAGTNTFKVSAASGGAAVNFTTDITDGSVLLYENLSSFAFDPRALAFVAGAPEDFGQELAKMLGIPQVMGYELVTHPESGITMAAVMWQEAGVGDIYWSPTIVYGFAAGKSSITTGHGAGVAAGTRLDYAGHRVITG